ncbi:OB-fold domain-containing protein [Nocardia sp. NBC_00565]|uniref:thiolase C-terminal domain-containing protein n=1 Tax=Nocardia sp. NBC_00565 TaxID=2975993 RepID=UPI002E7FE574|nr:OB-fold domain-containing protein [Nocardia sp. NBC_00565]WUC05614.1 OB-fold domain-containing protein [Nocardia sp. NBC_00565]
MSKSVVERPLPQPSISSEPFWTSGSDGLLRIARCDGCLRYHHPPQPICPECRCADVAMAPVSGRAVVAGFTVNHQQWLPKFPPPYVVAVVALDEDPSARLTTNIVGCDPADITIGMRVRVVFEQHDELWIPLFEPDPEQTESQGAVPEPRDLASAVRPMVSHTKFEDKVALTGVGSTTIGRRLMVDPLSLTVQACLRAVDDAGLTLADIDGLATYPGGYVGGLSEGGVTAVEEALRIRPTWISGGGEFPGPSGSVVSAMLAVASGLCRHVLCFRTVWEATRTELARTGRIRSGGGPASGMFEWRSPFGAMSAANWIGVNASHYFWRYGGDRASTLAPIALTARANAACNPEAIYRDPLTIDDYLGARMISSPFGLYDCDVPCDGAIAVIVSSIDTAADRPKPSVLVEAVGTQVIDRISWDQDTLTHEPQVFGPAAHLWSRTSLRPDDVDVAELYDGFTFNAVSWLEALGFCGLGEAADYLDGGRTIALDGKLPLNTHGGQLSAGRTHGFGFLQEAMRQLRGEATGRQVSNANIAVVTTGGGTPGGALLLRRGE